MKNRWYIHIIIIFLFSSCSSSSSDNDYIPTQNTPTPSPLNIPQVFEDNIIAPIIPIDNPQTVEGIALGKKLFFDPILSVDFSQACASCHLPQNAFTDSNTFSTGVNGDLGTRNSMPLFNLAWNYDENFFWDGRAFRLEHQALQPVTDPTEMANTWSEVVTRLNNHEEYPELFKAAFGNQDITKELTTKAIAQFERTLISANSKFDQFLLGQATLTPQEQNGLNIFMDEDRGDCFHCHGNPNNPLWTDNAFHNNGLDTTFSDNGLGQITGDPADNGKFKSPSLRNLAYTAPYMHDGRFTTLDEVINHYSEGLQDSPTIDPLMKKIDQGGVQLTDQDKADLKAFLLTLSDPSFINNPNFSNQ
ncbi:cytochrome-c peroxidase [Mangrovimonas cancribranchiae]|uniref:Cytochrome c peroxidase n=1 Tax=Mangrovimonas cancribranchiae TaxID=3080055 RepID=A0AAU6NVB6_9FLAO